MTERPTAMSEQDRPAPDPTLEDFLGEPTRDLGSWRWLWQQDRPFPIRSHHGPLGRLLVLFKRLLRPFVKLPQNDLWERQRVFNLIVLEELERARRFESELEPLLAEIDRLRWNAQEFKDLSIFLTRFLREGLDDIVAHNDALFARVDQKLDRYRREARQLWGSLGAALAAVEQGGDAPVELARARAEQAYLDLEERHRGTEEEIRQRFEGYLERLPQRGRALDLGCGRGESLALLGEHGLEVRGVDASATMVTQCRERGLDAVEGDLLEVLAAEEAGTLALVTCLHVIEHLPPQAVDRLVRLAWRALEPGGVLLLETPNPLSLAVSARSFWIDPTHRRPIHPEGLAALVESAGFESVERLDLRPFEDDERLPEIPLDGLGDEARQLADRMNRLRDRLDALVFGYRDYGLLAVKPVASGTDPASVAS